MNNLGDFVYKEVVVWSGKQVDEKLGESILWWLGKMERMDCQKNYNRGNVLEVVNLIDCVEKVD